MKSVVILANLACLLLLVTPSTLAANNIHGYIVIQMVEYVNPGGVVQNGQNCDFFNDPCEYLFRFCLSENNFDSQTCKYGYLQTQYFVGVQNIKFSIGQQVASTGLRNPFAGPFKARWPGRFTLFVNVDEDDSVFTQQTEPVDSMQQSFHILANQTATTYTLVGTRTAATPSRLTIKMHIQCKSPYSGNYCELDNNQCQNSPCLNNGICSDLGQGSYSCICPSDYTGNNCQTAIPTNPCVSHPCQNGGSCNSFGSQYLCNCPRHYTGQHCEIDIGFCISNPCGGNGTCTELLNGYRCTCPRDLTGPFCNTSLAPSPCADRVCHNGGSCVIDSATTSHCNCKAGYSGSSCQTDISNLCTPSPCHGNATCSVVGFKASCACPPQWTGKLCAQDLNFCRHNPCGSRGNCTNNGADNFLCTCKTDYTGIKCQTKLDPCFTVSCLHGGKCHVNGQSSYYCACLKGFTGKKCESDINECLNGNPCPTTNATCYNIFGGFRCSCPSQWTGKYCNQNLNSCANRPCRHGGTCTDTQPNQYTCTCIAGLTGSNCQSDISECASSPCFGNATCIDGLGNYTCRCQSGFTGATCSTPINSCTAKPCFNGATCRNQGNSYVCTCKPGYTGKSCETMIKACNNSPCTNGGSCTNTGPNAYSCKCSAGFTGYNCQSDINECSSSPCPINAMCLDGVNHYTCKCRPGYTGVTCQTKITNCRDKPCLNGASCQNITGGYLCRCVPGYTGSHCEININECASTPCQHGGTCVDGINKYKCSCTAPYVGNNCETAVNTGCTDANNNNFTDKQSFREKCNNCLCSITNIVCTQVWCGPTYCLTNSPNHHQCPDNTFCSKYGPDFCIRPPCQSGVGACNATKWGTNCLVKSITSPLPGGCYRSLVYVDPKKLIMGATAADICDHVRNLSIIAPTAGTNQLYIDCAVVGQINSKPVFAIVMKSSYPGLASAVMNALVAYLKKNPTAAFLSALTVPKTPISVTAIQDTRSASPVVPIVASISAVVAVAIIVGLVYLRYRRGSPVIVARTLRKFHFKRGNTGEDDDARMISSEIREEVTFDGRNQRYESPVFYEADVDSKSTTKIDNVARVNSAL
ncbi:uncharacterized protein TRIADDRAFT_57305 [Trichoplax adhaerens]|uniref:EGF-like domain-containing protein n=1 Tax=Trichoplax adhaerens TaxID=10228 RepID=B3RZ28_TRIAD|nr:hypothetical protein TRIADDRAFT_57305 [Trichoplax adhaerens]EDV23770.1 hypothetical protein TRIADDRAFT_57305 [Trichoplax adhaerens]|eukprot:XP_002113296.1 hypothetical protein TRIADDRAFT_57305 [Trichoplax adhaerens]